MRTIRRSVVLLAACAPLLAGSQASAQATPATGAPVHEAHDADAARRKFAAGLKLYGERAYVEALAEFEASYRLGGRASALRNVAQCQRDLRHFAEAYDAYARLLDVHGAQLTKSDREAVARAIDELSDLSGSVTVANTDPDATAELDGRPWTLTSPAPPRRVSLGAHTLTVRKAGFEPFEKAFVVESNRTIDIRVDLKPEIQTGHVLVREVHGDPVEVTVDGKSVGRAPWEGDLPPGDHTVEARGSTRAADARAFTVVRRERLELALDATPTLGHVRITSSPASATITLDGARVATGVFDADLPPGKHRVEIEAGGYEPVLREVNVARGELLSLDIPVSVAIARAPELRGVYARLTAFGYASPTATNIYASQASTDFHFALGGGLRIGYSFGVIGLELATTLMVEHYKATAAADTGSSGSVTGVEGFVGLGGRATSHGEVVHFTAGLAPGVVIHSITADDGGGGGGNCSSSQLVSPCGTTNGASSATGGYVAPGLLFDAGMMIGAPAGGRFFLGVQAMLDLAPTLYVGPVTSGQSPTSALFSGLSLRAVSGPQVYVGPTLGVQWGH